MTKPTSAPDLTDHHHRPAGIVTRVAAMCIDVAMVLVIGSILYVVVAGARFILSPTTFTWPDVPFFLTLTVQFCIAVVYLTFCWAMTGRTYGDSLLGLRVLSRFGRIPGWTLSFLRAVFCAFFPVGLFWVVLSPERRSIQDVVLRTVVVYDWRGAE
jgi:uncharacterized RDD family membrane protein YckC